LRDSREVGPKWRGFRRTTAERNAGELITVTPVEVRMPKTLEVVCTRDDCDLDMMELHYRYSMPDGTGAEAFSCPYCGADALEELNV
jgi:hypothetical protein